jgi:hypothetical protein
MTACIRPLIRDVHLGESSPPLDTAPAWPCRIGFICQSFEARPCRRSPHVYHLPALRVSVIEEHATLRATGLWNRGGNAELLLVHDHLRIHSAALNPDGSADFEALYSRSLALALYKTRELAATTLTTGLRLGFPRASSSILRAEGGAL